jgi:hypothetical protein
MEHSEELVVIMHAFGVRQPMFGGGNLARSATASTGSASAPPPI